MYGDALTTKERIKDRLQITVTSFDTLLDSLILAVTARIEQMTGRRFIEAVFTNELHDGSDAYGSRRLTLVVRNSPIQSISSVQYKSGANSSANWLDISEDTYDLDADAGLLHFYNGLPTGRQNIRITYTGGFSGYDIGLSSLWHFNVTPAGTVNGTNLTFTLPENADQVVVYPDGIREQSTNVTHTDGTSTFTLAAGRAPYSTIAADYRATALGTVGDITLPADLVELAEEAVTRLYKRRESEGRSSETFKDSSITWNRDLFSDEELATIRNYRRGYEL